MLDETHTDIKNDAKRSISLRISTTDFGKVKAIARRLRTRESDVFRFAIKMALAKLSPLYDERVKGTELMPVFVECGSDIALHFNLDSARLERVINDDLIDDDQRVDSEDIGLLAMSAMPERYLSVKLKEIADAPVDKMGVSEALRHYLNHKYVEPDSEHPGPQP